MKQEAEETPEWVQYVIYIVLGILITFDEAKEVIKTTSDWYSNTGSGNVREVEKNCKIIQYWKFKNNQIIDHVRWN